MLLSKTKNWFLENFKNPENYLKKKIKKFKEINFSKKKIFI